MLYFHIKIFLSHKNLQTINFTKNNDSHIINIILCDNSETKSTCDGIRSKIHVCLIRKHKNQADIGSKIKGNFQFLNCKYLLTISNYNSTFRYNTIKVEKL